MVPETFFNKESQMRKLTTLSSAIAVVALALAATSANAESTSGYDAAGTATVTANARVTLSVTVPKLILLRVGAAGAPQTNLAWTVGLSIPAGPVAPLAGNNQAANWDGTAPVFAAITNPAAVSAFAWTNSTGGGSLACAASALTAAGPVAADYAVASGAGLAHPGATAACATATTFPRNVLQTGTWTYSVAPATLNALAAGAYSGLITYTATSL
jgi:hypothetical protein